MAAHAPDGSPRPARRVFVVGDSSGGGLAAATVLAAQAHAEGISAIPLSGSSVPDVHSPFPMIRLSILSPVVALLRVTD